MISILKPHTKVRRLGYIKLIVLEFLTRDYIESSYFNKLFEEKYGGKETHKWLFEYKENYLFDDKGEITKIGSGNSAKPYIEFAIKSSMIVEVNHSYVLSKTGKVYKELLQQITSNTKEFELVNYTQPAYKLLFDQEKAYNPFVLSSFDFFYFLRSFILKDYLYISTILKCIKEKGSSPISENGIKFKSIKDTFQEAIVEKLVFLDKSSAVPLNNRRIIGDLIKKYKNLNWEIRSYENIVEPRIGWLIDLGLINRIQYHNKRLCLNKNGERFVNLIDEVINPIKFIEEKWFNVFHETYDLESVRKSRKISDNKLEILIDEAFKHFKTLIPNRINASQAINYVTYKAFFRDSLLLEYNQVKDFIFKKEGQNYIVDWFASENDGSIKKIIK